VPSIFLKDGDGLFIDNTYDAIGSMFKFILESLPVNPIETIAPPDVDYQDSGVYRRFD